ncbi:hypothetical protein [Paenibacillus sp. UMB4589-SE434]|uniref:hypothetical protein n=1 Tax=Paenibacillus sp. UMB4589-SE434 TaxID=3046314 RepID=UPI00254CDE0B|nr:hypothetical protein [Paenibacillus sp. UMB4589-SE434]MDK8181774.1 hypothetical protein [Paenibacillus sp. UMB4589-SE434]
MSYPSFSENNRRVEAGSSQQFVLWREVIMAYAAPAIMAGIGGLITGDKGLQIGALSSIGGMSAFVALMVGFWLQNRGIHKRWLVKAPHVVAVGAFALFGAGFGLVAAEVTTMLHDLWWPNSYIVWFSRVGIDFPLSTTIACVSVTWRWHSTVCTKSSKGEKQK